MKKAFRFLISIIIIFSVAFLLLTNVASASCKEQAYTINSYNAVIKEEKKQDAELLNSFDKMVPGKQYVDQEFLAKAKNEQDAKSIADSYDAQVVKYNKKSGIAVLKLKTGASMKDTLKKSSDEASNLAPISLNYIYQTSDDEVEYIPTDDLYKEQYCHQDMDSEVAWDIMKGDKSVVVAIIDTGIDTDNPEFSGRIVKPYNSYTGQEGVDCVEADYFHGTHVAGIIGAAQDNGGVTGIAPDVSLMPIKANIPTEASFTEDCLLDGIYYAVDNGAKVINMSLGRLKYYMGIDEYDPLEHDAIAYAYQSGVTVVCAAGNDSTSDAGYPAAYDESIAVSALRQGDIFDDRYSNYGPEIDIAAPGTSILSTMPGGGYESYSGTSMATPQVAGVCALLYSINPDLTVDQVKDYLYKGATDCGTPGWDEYYGNGALNAANSLLLEYPIAIKTFSIKNGDKDVNISPLFDNDVTNYIATVANDVDRITISATAQNSSSVITGTGQKELAEGINTFEMTITSADGKFAKTFTFDITRSQDNLSSDANLTDIQIEGTILSPSFDSDVTEYSATVDNNISSVKIIATKEDEGASVTGDGKRSLVLGTNNIQVAVTSQNGIVQKTYTLQIKRLEKNSEWLRVGPAGVGAANPSGSVDMVIDPLTDEPYIAFSDESNGEKASVMRYDGTNWVNVGSPGFSSLPAYNVQLAFNPGNDQPYVVLGNIDNNKKNVMRFDGTSWIGVGNLNNFSGINSLSLEFNPITDEPYVAYSTPNNVCVIKYNGTDWEYVGSPGFAQSGDVRFAIDNITGQAYVAFIDTDNPSKVSVMTYDESAWTYVGNNNVSTDNPLGFAFAINPSTHEPCVIYSDLTNNYEGTMMQFDGQNWTEISKDITEQDGVWINNISMVFSPITNEPYIAFVPGDNPKKTMIMNFDGKRWNAVGNPFYIIDQNSYAQIRLKITFGTKGEPYYIFTDPDWNGAVTVSRFGYPDDNEARLAAISTNIRYLTPLFDEDEYSYILNVDRDTEYIKLETEAVRPDATVKINGEIVPYQSYSGQIKLANGSNPISITVTSPDKSTEKTYIVNVIRQPSELSTIGSADFTNEYTSLQNLAFDPDTGDPYVVFRYDNSAKGCVLKYDGTNWTTLGAPDFNLWSSFGLTHLIVTAVNPVTKEPYVAFADITGYQKHYDTPASVSVAKYNGVSWEYVGQQCFLNSNPLEMSLAFDNQGIPYIAFVDKANGGHATIMRYDGMSWADVGDPSVMPLAFGKVSLVFDTESNQPYISFDDVSNYYEATVMCWDGLSWKTVGNADFSDSQAYQLNMAISPVDHEPYVVYWLNNNINVMKFDGANWVRLGNDQIYNLVGQKYFYLTDPRIAIDPNSGDPYICFIDRSDQKVDILRFDGINWVDAGYSTIYAGTCDMEFSPVSGELYIAYNDLLNDSKTTVRCLNKSQLLTSLTPSAGVYSSEFNSTEINYVLNLPQDVNKIAFTPQTSDPLSIVKINNETVQSGHQSSMIDVSNDDIVINVEVSPTDGFIKTTYHVLVTHSPKQSNAYLSYLNVNGYEISPDFSPLKSTYSLTVPYHVDNISISATAADEAANIDGINEKDLAVGINTLNINITSSDGTVKKTYLLNITRDQASKNAKLSAFGAMRYNISPIFSPDINDYDIIVPQNTNYVILTATQQDPFAKIKSTNIGKKDLSSAVSIFNVEVTAEDGMTKNIYTLKVIRGDYCHYLNSLKVASGGIEYAMLPKFDPTVNTYTCNVPSTVSQINIEAIPEDNNAQISGDGDKTVSYGNNEFTIKVTGQDGMAYKYYLNINREGPSHYLNSLKVTSGGTEYTMSPEFDPTVNTYTCNVPSTVSQINIEAMPVDSNAQISGNGNKALSYGSNEFVITVTGLDKTTYNYYITVNRSPSTSMPDKPENVFATAVGYNKIDITWSPAANVIGYQLYRSFSEYGIYSLVTSTKSISYVNNNLLTGTSYYYKVRSYNKIGKIIYYSDYSDISSATPALNPAAGVKAVMYNPTSIKISWSTVPGGSGYEIYSSTSPDSGFVLFKTTTKTRYININLIPNISYYYKIRVYRLVKKIKIYSAYSETVNAIPIFQTVSGLKIIGSTATSIKVSWNAVYGRSGYEILRSTLPDSGFTVIKSTNKTSFNDRGLIDGQTYYYKVRAYIIINKARIYSGDSDVISEIPS